MHSEVVTESIISVIVVEIQKGIEEHHNKLEICKVLKKLGRFTLDQFELDTPEWAEEFESLFAEKE